MSMRNSIRRSLRIQESVMTTIHHDFYGSRTGISNRIPVCPECNLPVRSRFYDNNDDATGNNLCKCEATKEQRL